MADIVSLGNQAALISPGYIEHSRSTGEPASTSSSGSPPAGETDSDFIELSGAQGLVQQALNSGTSARAARVQELKQQVESGQYVADPVATGNAIINAGIAGE